MGAKRDGAEQDACRGLAGQAPGGRSGQAAGRAGRAAHAPRGGGPGYVPPRAGRGRFKSGGAAGAGGGAGGARPVAARRGAAGGC